MTRSSKTGKGKAAAKAAKPARSSSSLPKPTTSAEVRAGHPRILVAGVDEVGRGCIAGPVVAAAVVLPAEIDRQACPWVSGIRDSKLMKAEDRGRIAPLIRDWALAWSIAEASLEEIEQLNIFYACHLAMRRALQGVQSMLAERGAGALAHILVDGNIVPRDLPQGIRGTAIVKGDQSCLSIAAASVIAKVHRDEMMVELDAKYPGYGLADHKGYGTPGHLEMLRKLGRSIIHRASFAPVAAAGDSQLALALDLEA